MGNMVNKVLSEERVPYDEESNNGYVIHDKYIPEEVVLELLSWVDYKSLLNCQLVCKRWNSLIQNCVWKKKAEMTLKHSLPIVHDAPWTMYYCVCDKKFDRNLIKNHCGQEGLNSHWKIVSSGGSGWKVENPPAGVPELPEDPAFDGKTHCFATSYSECWKYQIIDLIEEGINEYLLDSLQPPVKISEYYSARWDCSSVYVCTIELISDKDVILQSYNFSKAMEGEEQNKWYKFEHEFEHYGTGLRKIRFSHGGRDRQFWAGHYGAKMTCSCVTLGIPRFNDSADKTD